MSSFYDDASLVVIPSGYKTSKVYAEKPTDGSGDLAFTRTGDTATRVNSAGIIEKVRTNLYPRGSALLATGWTSVGATLTAGQTDPDGGTTALRVQLAAAQSPYAYIFQSLSGSAATYARSAYIKAASAQSIRIVDPHSGAGTTVNLTTDWQRFTAVGAGSGGNFGIQFDNDNDDAAKDFTIAFVQIETGDIATAYIPTTTAAVSVGPVSGLPRLDYLGSSCPRLLLEPQRTNLVTFSEQFDNAAWTKNQITLTANFATSPDGSTNADRAMETSADAYHDILGSFSATSGTVYTASCFVKSAGQNLIYIYISTGTAAAVKFNLSTGTVIGTALGTVVGSKITNYGNGWYRCEVSYTAGATTTATISISTTNSTALSLAPYIGDPTKGILVYGYQVEAGAYATSYIPTLGTSVTRVADVAVKTGISSLIGQTEGTIYFEINKTQRTDSEYRLNLSDGSATNWIFLGIEKNNVPRFYVRAAASTDVDFSGSSLSSGTHKVAAAYKQNDFVLYVDGVLVGSDTSGNVGGTSQMDFGGNYISQVAETDSRTAEILLFKTRLTNAQMASLTSL